MKHVFVIATALLMAFATLAQDQKPGTISVTGKAEMSVNPDMVVFNLTITAINKDFSIALDELNSQTNTLKESLNKAGVSEADLKTTNYSVREESKYISGKQTLVGHRATHGFEIRTTHDALSLKNIYDAIKSSGVETSMRISFTISDPEKYKMELMTMAVHDAKMQAQTLAMAAEVALGPIKKIDYGVVGTNRRINTYGLAVRMDAESADANISVNPGEMKLTEVVSVVYFIAK